jgi:hypothetical protein
MKLGYYVVGRIRAIVGPVASNTVFMGLSRHLRAVMTTLIKCI